MQIAISGRPNVGKSTLFNRLIGHKTALTSDAPGLTRDCRQAIIDIQGHKITLIDTAGIITDKKAKELDLLVSKHNLQKIEQSHMALFVIDGKKGVTNQDLDIIDVLRPKLPLFAVVNKSDCSAAKKNFFQALELGINNSTLISAEHGLGIEELKQKILSCIKNTKLNKIDENLNESEPKEFPKIAILGRPNCGKSTLLNCLAKEKIMLTSPTPFITRDAIETKINDNLILIDTAGLRRQSHIVSKIEKLTAKDTKKALSYANFAILMIDATIGITKNDLALARMIAYQGKPLIIAVNKWDVCERRQVLRQYISERLEEGFKQIKNIKLLFISALKNYKIKELQDSIYELIGNEKRISTGKLNNWLQRLINENQILRKHKIFYMTQISVAPACFVLFVSRPQNIKDNHRSFITNRLSRDFNFQSTPLRLIIKRAS